MKLPEDRKYLKLIIVQRGLWFTTGVGFLVTVVFALMFLIKIMCMTELSAKDTWPFMLLFPITNILESELLRFVVKLSSTSVGMFSLMHKPKYTLASLISLVIMLIFTFYLVLLSFRFRECHQERGVRRSRVSSCLWTRRKVYWLQQRHSRAAYILAARESSIQVKKCFEKEVPDRSELLFTNYCSNILKIATLALIAVMTGIELQMLNDLQRHK